MSNHSMTRREKRTKTPGGKSKIEYKKKKKGKLDCATCGKPLHGVPGGGSTARISKLSKTQKRPSVLYGGTLCGECRERIIIDAAFVKTGQKNIDDVPIKKRGFVAEAVKKVF